MQKRADSEGQDQQSEQGHHCLLTESVVITEIETVFRVLISDPSIPGLVTIVLNTCFINMMMSWL